MKSWQSFWLKRHTQIRLKPDCLLCSVRTGNVTHVQCHSEMALLDFLEYKQTFEFTFLSQKPSFVRKRTCPKMLASNTFTNLEVPPWWSNQLCASLVSARQERTKRKRLFFWNENGVRTLTILPKEQLVLILSTLTSPNFAAKCFGWQLCQNVLWCVACPTLVRNVVCAGAGRAVLCHITAKRASPPYCWGSAEPA